MKKVNLNAREYRKSMYVYCAVFSFFCSFFGSLVLTMETPEAERINPTLAILVLYLSLISMIGIYELYLTHLGEQNLWITKDVDKFIVHYIYEANKIEVKQGEELIIHLVTGGPYGRPHLYFKNEQTNEELKCKFSLNAGRVYGEVLQLFKENNFELTSFIGTEINNDYKIKYNYPQEVSKTDNI